MTKRSPGASSKIMPSNSIERKLQVCDGCFMEVNVKVCVLGCGKLTGEKRKREREQRLQNVPDALYTFAYRIRVCSDV